MSYLSDVDGINNPVEVTMISLTCSAYLDYVFGVTLPEPKETSSKTTTTNEGGNFFSFERSFDFGGSARILFSGSGCIDATSCHECDGREIPHTVTGLITFDTVICTLLKTNTHYHLPTGSSGEKTQLFDEAWGGISAEESTDGALSGFGDTGFGSFECYPIGKYIDGHFKK